MNMTSSPVYPDTITTLYFSATTSDFRTAAIFLREAIGQIPALSDSLLGNSPHCAEKLGISLKQHRLMRRFFTMEGLHDFCDYLAEVIAREPDPEQRARFLPLEVGGFHYCTTQRRAKITLIFEEGEWLVFGTASFRDPSIAWRNLEQKGFTVARVDEGK